MAGLQLWDSLPWVDQQLQSLFSCLVLAWLLGICPRQGCFRALRDVGRICMQNLVFPFPGALLSWVSLSFSSHSNLPEFWSPVFQVRKIQVLSELQLFLFLMGLGLQNMKLAQCKSLFLSVDLPLISAYFWLCSLYYFLYFVQSL